MPRKNSFATCLCSLIALACCGVALRAAPQPLDVMPAPSQVRTGAGRAALADGFVFTLSDPADARLILATGRFQARWNARSGLSHPGNAAPSALQVKVQTTSRAPEYPTGSEDESYELHVSAKGVILSAATDLGALHGLETLLQLPRRDGGSWSLQECDILDRPRFAFRGLLIDVARHWQPADVIRRNVDAMAVVKLNVLHLHLTDDQGFRIESRTHPELQTQGSDGHFYTQAEMADLIRYAALRGIRVVPEFDVPGHTTSWVVSHPELASLPGPYAIERWWGVFNPVLDPTKEATYALLADVLGEMAALFPDRMFHIGGDENNGVQWNANPAIQAFIREHGLHDNPGLHAYFNKRLNAILEKAGKRMVGWDEIANPQLPTDIVIDSWRGTEAIASSTALGFDCLRANGFYIDLCYPAASHYLADPVPDPSKLTQSQLSHILGGEATMWGEWVSPETIDSRIWPRTAAIAERLWSPASVTDVPDMYRRLATVSLRLDEAGALHLRYRDGMLRHLVGANLGFPGSESLRTVVDLLEPVKQYRRGTLQIWSNQLVPLIGLADATLPESDLARHFSEDVEAAVFAGTRADSAALASLRERLKAWNAAAADIDGIADVYPGVREAIVPAAGLRATAAAGIEALDALAAGRTLEPERAKAARAALDGASADSPSAVIVPLVPPVRLLVAAASAQDRRAALAPQAWQDLVRTLALPEKPPTHSKHYN